MIHKHFMDKCPSKRSTLSSHEAKSAMCSLAHRTLPLPQDRWEQVVLNLYIKPATAIVSCLTPLTGCVMSKMDQPTANIHATATCTRSTRSDRGYLTSPALHRRLTPELLDQRGVSLEEGLQTLRQYLPPDAVLVGQGINQDVQWLSLHEGRDYQVCVGNWATGEMGNRRLGGLLGLHMPQLVQSSSI